MKANYHTHTYRCHHAVGSEEDYIKKAIKEGLEVLGFSDHAPFNFFGDYLSHCRMEISQIDEYFDTILNLKEKYKGDIKILIGFEIEYFTKLWDNAIETYKKYPLDYLILGQHFTKNEFEPDSKDINKYTHDKNVLVEYVEKCISAIETGRISYVAHPDYCLYKENENDYLFEMRKLVERAKELNVPLEYNLYGKRLGRHYPNDSFWQMVSKVGAPVVFGCDAHKVEQVADKKEIEDAKIFAKNLNLNVLEKIELKNPIF